VEIVSPPPEYREGARGNGLFGFSSISIRYAPPQPTLFAGASGKRRQALSAALSPHFRPKVVFF
jgi:hypothetical protein